MNTTLTVREGASIGGYKLSTKPEEPRFGGGLTKPELSPSRRSSPPNRSPPSRRSPGLVMTSPKSSSHQTGGAPVWWRSHQVGALHQAGAHQTGRALVWWRPHQNQALTKPEKLSTKPEPTKPEEPRFGGGLTKPELLTKPEPIKPEEPRFGEAATKLELSPNRRSSGPVTVSPSRSSPPRVPPTYQPGEAPV
ncbi:hypothetical protein IMSHALPRED_004536 [Imshaugia aleurites]|uniref:Uncharacterized protein n=1 Tax=Imshaugia aleurites TaxID=172621 RepID=A0A8H3FE18_9LECA|nr:hypothetical protein IMSHALPRED_004536 [Imshaugia aleurites]